MIELLFEAELSLSKWYFDLDFADAPNLTYAAVWKEMQEMHILHNKGKCLELCVAFQREKKVQNFKSN